MPNDSQLVEIQPDEIGTQDFLDRQNWKGYENSWISDGFRLIFIDSSFKASLSTFDELEHAWRKKCDHILFDKYVKIFFSYPEDVARSWHRLVDAFTRLSSKDMSFVLGEEREDMNSAKKSGGATVAVDSKDLSLRRTLPNGIKSNEKPISFEAGEFQLSVFPTFIAITVDGKISSIWPLWDVSLTDDQSVMIGAAPSDAHVTGKVPKNINLSGTNKGKVDKRFNQNKMLDKYLVDSIVIKIRKMDIEFLFSNPGRAKEFCSEYFGYMSAQTKWQSSIQLSDSGITKSSNGIDLFVQQLAKKQGISENDNEDYGGDEEVLYWYSDATEFVKNVHNVSTAQLQQHLNVDHDLAEKLLQRMEYYFIVSEPNNVGIRTYSGFLDYSGILEDDET